MTENKRFTLEEFGLNFIVNDNGRNLTAKQTVDKLNELHEENQDFKAFNKELAEELSVCANARISKDNRIKRIEEKIQRERTSFTKTQARWRKEAENKIKELSEENQRLQYFESLYRKRNLQLEKENKELKQELLEVIDASRDNRPNKKGFMGNGRFA